MAQFRQQNAEESSSPFDTRSRGSEEPYRWKEYMGPDTNSAATSRPSKNRTPDTFSNGASKGMSLQWVFQLSEVAEGLMSKIYKFNQILDHPDPVGHVYSEAFWRAGVFPNSPRICVLLSKKFPDHFSKLQLDRVDKASLDALIDGAEVYLQNLEPYVQFLLDLMLFREQALRLILDLSSTIITLLPHQNSLMLHAFMDLFCSFVRVNLLSEKFPRKMVLQTFNLLYSLSRNERDCDFYHRLVQFIDSYDPPLKGLQEDLNFVSPRIGEVLEAVGPIIFLSADTKKLRNEGFLSPYHPRYPDILTNSAHPMRAQDLAHVTSYRDWVILGYLVCPDELLRVTSIDIALVVLKENLIITLFRDEYALLHEDYQHYVLPRILESKKMAKSGRSKQKEADLEYSVAKQVEKMISEVNDQALQYCDAIHLERRILLKQEIGRMVIFFTDQPSLLAPNIHMVFSALALAQSEVLWYFQHVGIASSKSKIARSVAVEIDVGDPTIGFLLDGMDHLCCLVRKYISAIRGYALSFLTSCAGRIRFLLGTPGMVALDLDTKMKGLFQEIIRHLETIPKPQSENISRVNCDLSDFRKDWLSLLMIVTSSRSSINIRHLEKATISTGKEGLLSEGNAAFSWSRCVDEIELQLCKHGSLRKLYFYHHHLTTVFKNTMFGPEGRPQHCCAWLGVASSFPDCASPVISEEATKIGRDAVIYVESLIESIMGGLEGLINILDSDAGVGALESQLLPEQAAFYLNNISRSTNSSTKSPKGPFALPGQESFLENNNSVKMLEAAMQRLTNLCSVLNEMEPICVLNNVFVLREYMRECILGNFKRRLLAVINNENGLQRPSVIESLIRRHMSIIHITEQHVSMDLTLGAREILLSEAFTGPVASLQLFDKSSNLATGSATDLICNWYVDNIIKDVSGAGIMFAPFHKCYESARPLGGYFADSVTDQTELKSFVRLFGIYGVDKLRRMLKEHTAALLNCIDSSLRANHEVLEAVASSMHSGDRIERETSCRQILDLDTVMGFCIEAGQALAFNQLLSEACGSVLKESGLLIHSLLEGVVDHIAMSSPEKKEVLRMQEVANSVGLTKECDSLWIRSILRDASGANSGSWELLPYMFASFMSSNVWMNTVLKVDSGGFTNNMHCLGRCISGLIAGSEMVRLERDYRVSRNDAFDETSGTVSAEISVKSAMQLFVKFAAVVSLDSWNDVNRYQILSKLVFLDQLCEHSPYLPRSTLEVHIPYEILRSVYSQYYTASPTMPLSQPAASPSQTPAIFTSPLVKPTPQVILNDNNRTSAPSDNSSDGERAQVRQKNVQLSGPIEYSSSRKVKFAETSGSGPTGSRFAVSRSGPLLYKLNSRT